jgi:hypothetical protein
MHPSVMEFGRRKLTAELIRGARVLEIGSQNINGSLRSYVEPLGPSFYIGIDLEPGLGVNIVCAVHDLGRYLSRTDFDIVICTEVLEHTYDWKGLIEGIKSSISPGGCILLTTRSPGFRYHPFPEDHWRFTIENMKDIFADFDTSVEADLEPAHPGVFVFARKPFHFTPVSLDQIIAQPAPNEGPARLAHYYFAKALPGWKWTDILTEHTDALTKSGLLRELNGGLRLCVVGAPSIRKQIIDFCEKKVATTVCLQLDNGYEYDALDVLQSEVDTYDLVLFAHTKGISYTRLDDPERKWNVSWRHAMTQAVIYNWRECIRLLQDHDAVGCHWVQEPGYTTYHFGGNFWWLHASAVQMMPRSLRGSRWDAEKWIGRGPPLKIVDLAPGWPNPHILYRGSHTPVSP